MEKEFDIKKSSIFNRKILYNIPGVEMFLDIFDLSLEHIDDNSCCHSINIYMENIESGKVTFNENEIIIKSFSTYGDLECKTSYVEPFVMTDIESFQTMEQLGLYGSLGNIFDFTLTMDHDRIFSGRVQFDVKVDNEFGNRISAHFKLKYQDGNKEYDIRLNENGYPFIFIGRQESFKEEIVYSLFDTCGKGSYIYHSKYDNFMDGMNRYHYEETSYITDSLGGHNNALAGGTYKEFNGKFITQNCSEFSRVSSDDESANEIMNKANFMYLIDSQCTEKIHQLIREFSVENNSFLEKILVYGFNNYSEEEFYALFRISKNNRSLDDICFKGNRAKSFGKKLFIPEGK